MDKEQPDLTDERWGGYVPWFLRHQNFSGTGNFQTFFSRLSQRLERLIKFNEPAIPDALHFGAKLETESLQRFRESGEHPCFDPIDQQLKRFFHPETLKITAARLTEKEVSKTKATVADIPKQFFQSYDKLDDKEAILVKEGVKRKEEKYPELFQSHYRKIVIERVGVLEALLRILPENPAASELRRDIRRFFAESGIMLDIRGIPPLPPLIVPMEEPLLQKEVIDKLLPRLESGFPERAQELVQAYHKLIEGEDFGSVFIEAFKTLEEIARTLTKDKSFMFDNKKLKEYFPNLHPTVHETMIRLAGHRGDEGGHGRSAPDPHEIRYLLFSICNVALLLLDYPKSETS